MKKTAFTLKGIINSPNGFYLLLLLFPLFIQSCSTSEYLEYQIQGSIDRNSQRFSGPSYPNPSPDKSLNGFNIGALASGGVMPGKPKSSSSFNDADFGRFGNVYASNSHGSSAFYNSSENDGEEAVKTYRDKVSSGFMSHLGYSVGIEFIQKKSKDGNTTITLNYLQVPLYALYYYQLPAATGSIFGGLGPYFAYGIGGNKKTDNNGQISKTKAFDKTTGYKPFDAGLSITAGYKITNSFSFSLAYYIGLVNIERNAFGDKAKNRGISLNVGYPLNKLIKK